MIFSQMVLNNMYTHSVWCRTNSYSYCEQLPWIPKRRLVHTHLILWSRNTAANKIPHL